MNILNEHNSTKDDTADHLIAFLVILGAIAFILQQSFSGNTSDTLDKQVLTKQELPQTTTSYSATKDNRQELTYEEKQQAKRDFEKRSARGRTDELEQQDIQNTSYQTPKRSTNLAAPIVAATTPLVASTIEKEIPLAEPVQKKAGTTIVKEKDEKVIQPKNKQNFIATNEAKEGLEATKTQLNAKKEITDLAKKPVIKESVPAKVVPKQNIAPKEKQVDTYEATTPAIVPNKEALVNKGIAAKKRVKKKTARKKVAKKSCAIIVASLNDAENIKRLVEALEADNFSIYNKRSGKYRAIGVQTYCSPASYQPILQKIQKKYAADAWLKKL